MDLNDNIYISDTYNHVIRYVNSETNVITTIAGNHDQGYNGDNAAATSASLNTPLGQVHSPFTYIKLNAFIIHDRLSTSV